EHGASVLVERDVDRRHRANLTTSDEVANRGEGVEVTVVLANHQHTPGAVGDLDQFAGVLDGGGERFLHEDVLARFEELPGDGPVRGRRGHDHGGVELEGGEGIVEAPEAPL